MRANIRRTSADDAWYSERPTGADEWLVIRPAISWKPTALRTLWAYRELLYFLAWRDFKVRYKQTLVGVAWAALRPFLTMLIFSVIFGHFARIPSEGIPYPIFSYCGLLPWLFFSQAVNQASQSVVSNAHIITKVYFPRIVIPLSAILASFVDFAVSLALLVGMMIWYHVVPTPALLLLPLLIIVTVVAAAGVGLWLAALGVQYRDVGHVVPFLLQLWLFVTPIVYPLQIVNGPVRFLLTLNPMCGVVEGFRWAVTGATPPDVMSMLLSSAVSVALVGTGAVYFARAEQKFADVA